MPGTADASSAQKTFFCLRACVATPSDRGMSSARNAPFSNPQRTRNFPSSSSPIKQRPNPRKRAARITDLRHELVGLAGGAKFAGNFEHFMQFLRLRARHPVQLGVGDRHCAKHGKRGDQRFLFLRERSGCPRINQNRAVRTRSAERRRNERPCRRDPRRSGKHRRY